MRRTARTILVLLPLAALSCGGGAAPQATRPAKTEAKRPTAVPETKTQELPLAAELIGQLEEDDASPYFARRTDGALVLYNAKGRFWTRALDAKGRPRTDKPQNLAPFVAGTVSVALVATETGYLAAWAEPLDGNQVLYVAVFDKSGTIDGGITTAARSADEMAWLEVLPNRNGALLVWEKSRAEKSDLFAVAVGVNGKPLTGQSSPIKDALGWQAHATPDGALLAIVEPAVMKQDKSAGKKSAKKEKRANNTASENAPLLGQVAAVFLDSTGKVQGRTIVSDTPTAHPDVQAASVAGNFVFAWTDERDVDPSVFTSVVGKNGSLVRPPVRATTPSGEQALVSLVGGESPEDKFALLSFEDVLTAPREERLIRLSVVDKDGVVGPARTQLLMASSGTPDLAVDGVGFAALTLAPAMKDSESEGPVWPTFVRFGSDLSVISSEPIRSPVFGGPDSVPYLVRDLSCSNGRCSVLGTGAGQGAPLALVSLEPRKSAWRTPAMREDPNARPRASGMRALYQGEHLARAAAAELRSGGSLAAWVTYFVDGSRSAKAKKDADLPQAILSLRKISPSGAFGETHTISRRAVSVGGVSIAVAGNRKEEAVLGWVGKDKEKPAQVFLTKVSASGDKLAQKQLTTASRKGGSGAEPSYVSVAYAPFTEKKDGYLAAWIDPRHENGEVYVASVDRDLETIAERRITESEGDASDVQMLVSPQATLLIWAEPQSKAEDSNSDIFVGQFNARTLERISENTRLFASPEHSRSPVLTPTNDGFAAAWIEEPTKENSGVSGVRIAFLDKNAHIIGNPELVQKDPSSTIASLAFDCSGKNTCRGVISLIHGEMQSLEGFTIEKGRAASSIRPLVTLTGGAGIDASPVFANAANTLMVFVDDSSSGNGRVRLLDVEW